MLKVGLTGGIGSGKSTVAKMFQQLDIPVIDADVIARELVKAGSSLQQQIKQHFGKEFFDHENNLLRSKLGAYIFEHPAEKQWLENLLHPAIFQEIKQQTAALKASYCIIEIPLLIESNAFMLIDRVLVVDLPETLQLQRCMQQRGLGQPHAEKIIQQQASRQQRLAIANDIVDNSRDMENTRQQVEQLHQQYQTLVR